MNRQVRHNGFSLTEVLIATGILALGLVMIAMAFPVGVKLASIATERPVGVVAANEAFAKLCLYSQDPDGAGNLTVNYMATEPNIIPINTCWDLPTLQAQEKQYFIPPQIPSIWAMPNDERVYPSLVPLPEEKRYYWSALVRRANSNTGEVQATVFVCRMLGMGSSYYDMDAPPANMNNAWPVPVKVRVGTTALAREIQVVIPSPLIYPPSGTEYRFFTEGCMVVEDSTGTIYKVMEMKDNSIPPDGIRETLVLDKAFTGAALPDVWVVPPAIGSSRNPCIDVVQKPLAF